MVSLKTIEEIVISIKKRITYDELIKMDDNSKFFVIDEIDEYLSKIQFCIKEIKGEIDGNM